MIPSPFDLDGRVALVTGGSRGLGRAMSVALADAGAAVIVVSRNRQACDDLVTHIRHRGGRAAAHACHVGRWDALEELVDTAYAEWGRVDVLINNAGKSPPHGRPEEITQGQWESVLALNLAAPFRLSALVGSRMRQGDGGSIINISSMLATRPSSGSIPYSVAKAGVNALTSALAAALAPKVRVNCIVPGAFETDVSNHWSTSFKKEVTSAAALQRIGRPEEIVGATLYLASDASSYTTGAMLNVDGGSR